MARSNARGIIGVAVLNAARAISPYKGSLTMHLAPPSIRLPLHIRRWLLAALPLLVAGCAKMEPIEITIEPRTIAAGAFISEPFTVKETSDFQADVTVVKGGVGRNDETKEDEGKVRLFVFTEAEFTSFQADKMQALPKLALPLFLDDGENRRMVRAETLTKRLNPGDYHFVAFALAQADVGVKIRITPFDPQQKVKRPTEP